MPRSRSLRTEGARRPARTRPPGGEIGRLIALFDGAWQGPSWHGPSVRESLDGVTAREAAARPVARAHSIGELVLHMAAWKRAVAHRLEGRPYSPSAEENFPAFRERDWAKALRTLRREHAGLRAVLVGLAASRLARPAVPGGSPVFVQAHGIVHHDLWHAGQILVLRRALEAGSRPRR